MTINKSQGQSFSYVGLYLDKLIFCHGQPYVAMFRVIHKGGLQILIHDKDNIVFMQINDIVYKELFHNIN